MHIKEVIKLFLGKNDKKNKNIASKTGPKRYCSLFILSVAEKMPFFDHVRPSTCGSQRPG